MRDREIAQGWVDHFAHCEDRQHCVDALYELSRNAPDRAWKIIRMIDAINIPDAAWRANVDGVLGCGPLENILVMHTGQVLDKVIAEAKVNERLRCQLAVIHESSVSKEIWKVIQEVLKHDKDDANTA